MNGSDENVHLQYLVSKIPTPLKGAPLSRLVSMANKETSVPDWYVNARRIDRQYLKQLSSERWRLQDTLDGTLADLQKDIGEFAEPLLVQALEQQLNLKLDVNKTLIKLYIPSPLGLGIDNNASRVRQSTLLQAALHNFEESETREGAYRDGSGIFVVDAQGALERHSLTVAAFATLCRQLDLGAQYHRHVIGLLKPADTDARQSVARHFSDAEKATFSESALIAHLKGDVSAHAYGKLKQLSDNQQDITLGGRPLLAHRLSLLGVKLTGIVLFSAVADPTHIKRIYDSLIPVHQRLMMTWSRQLAILPGQEFDQFKILQGFFANGPGSVVEDMLRRDDEYKQSRLDGKLIAYVPDDPDHPLKEYDSFTDFMKELTRQLRLSDYQQFFSRFVPQKDKGHFFSRVRERFTTFTWQQREPLDMGPWWRETAVENPDAQPITVPIEGDLWWQISQWRCNKAIADARQIAVPTGDEDANARWARLSSYANIGWNVFIFGAMLVPGVGDAVLGIMVGQMMFEAMEGVEDWSRGDKEEAAGHLCGVLINFAQLAIMAAGHVLPAGAAAVRPSTFVDQLKPVERADGTVSLWNPDLSPYEHTMSAGRQYLPNERGLLLNNDQELLSLDGKYFSVKDDPHTGQSRALHPDRPNAYQPKLAHNGAGTWYTELDRPIEWDKTALMRRLGMMVDAFDDATLEQIRIVSGVEENLLRRLHVESEAPPALLIDTISRFKARAQTGKLPESVPSSSANASAAVLQDAYPQLPTPIAEELLANAEAGDVQILAEHKRIPLQLRQQVRAALLEVRVARAYEGLFLDALQAPDTERLALHSLEALPNWPSDVRIEIREHSFTGRLRDAIGPQDAQVQKVLVSTEGHYEARDAADHHLHGPDNLFASVLHALPDEERQALGYEINQAATLRQAVQRAPLTRNTFKPMLAENPLQKPIYDPLTMRLRGGVRGYPQISYSSEVFGRRVSSLYPAFTAEQVDELLSGFGSQADHRLKLLEAEFSSMCRSFERWVNSPTAAFRLSPRGVAQWNSRNTLYRRFRQCWQRTGPRGSDATGITHPQRLDLSGLHMDQHLAGMPELRANFDHVTLLDMSDSKLLDSQQDFLKSFRNLRSLTLAKNLLTSIPEAITDMPFLIDLMLDDNQIRLTDVGVARLKSMTQLRSLRLSNNPLGLAPDISRMPYMQALTLDSTGLDSWPTGFFAQPRPRSIYLNLRYNPITRIPQVAPGSFRAELLARTFLSREPRWMSAQNLAQLKDYIESVGMEPDRPYPPRGMLDSADWVGDLSLDEWNAKQEAWDTVEDEFDSVPFFNEIRKLTQSADFGAQDTTYRYQLSSKVWRMLAAMERDTELRESIFAQAVVATECADGGTQLFNAMGFQVLVHEAYGLINPALVEAELVTLAQGKSRLNELGSIARRRVAERLNAGESFRYVDGTGLVVGTIDEVEVHLAYMTDLAARLDLPWQSRGMLFRNMAGVSKVMIEAAFVRVLAVEQGELLADLILEQPFWETYLEEAYRREFNDLKLSLEDADEMEQFAAIKALSKTLTQQAIDRARLQRVEMPFTVEPPR